jgi:hypothetical protein
VLDVPHVAGTLDAVVIRQAAEIDRRARFGLGAITDPMVIEACADLPVGMPVPADQLDPIARVALDGCPPGIVEVVDGSYVRLWRPAVDVTAVSSSCGPRSWLSALGQLSTGVGLADRYLLVEGPTAPRSLIARAQRVGAGVVAVGDGDATIVCRPSGHPLRPGVRRWAFLEAAYELLMQQLTGSSTRPEEPSAARRGRQSGSPASPRR